MTAPIYDLNQLRAKRGHAAEKKVLMEEYRIMQGMSWHYTILSIDNAESTYGGSFPEGIGKRRVAHEANLKALEAKIRSICH